MNKQEYQEYLKSEHWKNLRGQKIRGKGAICEICGSKENINIHHMEYKNIYDIKAYQLRVLCKTCHETIHNHLKLFPLKKYCFAELQFIVKRNREIAIFFRKADSHTSVRKLRAILKESGFKMCGLSHERTIDLCSAIGII